MSINLPNYGRSSSRQSTYQHHHNQHHAPQPPPQPFRVEAAASERRRRSEDAQPNLDEGKNLRPAHYVIGRREPEPAPPQVLASASIRPAAAAGVASGRLQASGNGAVAAAARPAAATYSRANPSQARPGPAVSNQVPTGPRSSSSSIASGSGQAWPERGQRSTYTPSNATNQGYTGNSIGAPARTPTSTNSGRAHPTEEGQAYRTSSAAASTSKVSQSDATASSSTARPTVRPPVPPMPFKRTATSTSVPSPVLPDPAARNPLFRPPANTSTTNAPKAAPAATVVPSHPSNSFSTAPLASSSNSAGPSLFRPRSPSPVDVKPNVQNLRREEPVASASRSAPVASVARPPSSSEGRANGPPNLRNSITDRPLGGSGAPASTRSHETTTRTEGARPTPNGQIHQPASTVNEATLPAARSAAPPLAELPRPQRYLEVFPLPLECRHTGDYISDQVRDKRSLFIQSLYEDLEIQHSKPIIPLNNSFLEEEVELEYQFEELRENEICVKLPVGIRRSSAHFAGSVAPARESFKLGQVAWFAHHQEKMAKETHFTFAHLVLRFGEPARTTSRSSSAAPPRSSLPPSASYPNRVQAVQQDNFAVPRLSPAGNASLPKVKQEPGSPANGVSAPVNQDSPNVAPPAAPARPPTPPRPQHPGFPLNARGSYTDVQLTQKNVDAFLQIFLDRFENKRSGGRLIDFYSQEAIFSYTDVTSVPAINGKDSRTTIRAFGQYQITNTMKKIPVCTFARDEAGKLFYDATRVGVSTNPLAFLPILVNLHGQFKELESGLERSFDRTIYLHPVSGGNSYGGAAGLQYTIQSDQIFVRPLVDHQDWFVGRLPARKVPPAAMQKKPVQEARRPFVREQSIMLPMPELESTAVHRAIVDASRQERDRDLGIAAGQASETARQGQPAQAAPHRPGLPTQPANRPNTASAAPATLPNGANSVPRPRPVPTASLRAAQATASSSQPSTPAGSSAQLQPAASTSAAASTSSNPRASTSASKVPSKRTIIEIDDSEDEELPEVERLVSQSSTIRAGPADARRVKQKMQESLAASVGSSTKRPVASPSPEPGDNIAAQPAGAPKKAKKAKVAAQPIAVPSEVNRKLTKSEKKARRKAREEQEQAHNQPAALQRTRPGPNAFTFGSQSTISHPMHGTGNKARKMFELEQLGGYLGVNFRGNVYYWKGDTSSVGAACLDREADEKLQVDDCIWSEKHQTIVLGYACPNAGETRPTTQLAIVRADEAEVDKYGEMTGLKREILDATPHDKVGITSLALLDQGGERNLSFVSAGNDRKISLWTVPKDGNQNVRCRAIPASHTSRITSMVWKRHGQHLATVGMDKRLCLMDLGAGRAKTISETKELLPMGHVLLHNEHQALLVLLAAKDQFKYVDLRTPSTSKALTFGRQLNSTLGAFTHGEWRDNLFAYAFEDVVAIWDIRNTSKPREEKWGSSGVIQPHFESDHSLALLEKKHFTKVTYSYAAQ